MARRVSVSMVAAALLAVVLACRPAPQSGMPGNGHAKRDKLAAELAKCLSIASTFSFAVPTAQVIAVNGVPIQSPAPAPSATLQAKLAAQSAPAYTLDLDLDGVMVAIGKSLAMSPNEKITHCRLIVFAKTDASYALENPCVKDPRDNLQLALGKSGEAWNGFREATVAPFLVTPCMPGLSKDDPGLSKEDMDADVILVTDRRLIHLMVAYREKPGQGKKRWSFDFF